MRTNLEKLERVLSCFGHPFLEKGVVVCKRSDNGTLRVFIGRREVEVDEDLRVVGAGTNLLEKAGIPG